MFVSLNYLIRRDVKAFFGIVFSSTLASTSALRPQFLLLHQSFSIQRCRASQLRDRSRLETSQSDASPFKRRSLS
ncbi:MAG TPA: hypothetical protein V6C85_32730 [Allocoleopsis sp.]